jgi:hypothetical protein
MKKHTTYPLVLLASFALILSTLSTNETQASTFQLTESIADNFNNLSTVTATFTGTLEGKYVDNISNVSLSINGMSPPTTVYAFGGDAQRIMHNGQAIVGINDYQQLNNFYFVNDGIANDSYPSFQYYVFAGLTAYENASYPKNGITLYTLIQDLSHDTRIYNAIGGNLYYYNTPISNPQRGYSNTPYTFTYNLVETISSVPEPEEWAMLMLGIPLVGWQIHRKQRGKGRRMG